MVISSRTPEGKPNDCQVCGSAITIEPSDPASDAPCPNCGHLLWFNWNDTGDAVVIIPSARFLQAENVKSLVDHLPERRGKLLVLDLNSAQFLTTSDFAQLVVLQRKVAGVRGKLRLINVPPELLDVFRITHLDQVFEIVD